MWSIHVVENTLELTEDIGKALIKASKRTDHEFDDDEEVVYRGRPTFNPDWYEHMDWLTEPKLVKVLKKYKVKGTVGFADLEGCPDPHFWSYHFDGKGGMVEKTGKVVWEENAK